MSGRAIALSGVALLLACIAAPREVGHEQLLGAGGLERVPSRRVGACYVRPGASLDGYSQVRIALVGVEYRRPPKSLRSGPYGGGGNYALTPEQRVRLEREFLAAFRRELVESGLYAAAARPGPEVLDVRGRVIDLVVDLPPEPRQLDRSFVHRAGELTLVIEVADSRSGEAILRIADRRVLSQTAGDELYRSDPVSNMAELRKHLSRWARLLRERLSELRQLDAIPAA